MSATAAVIVFVAVAANATLGTLAQIVPLVDAQINAATRERVSGSKRSQASSHSASANASPKTAVSPAKTARVAHALTAAAARVNVLSMVASVTLVSWVTVARRNIA